MKSERVKILNKEDTRFRIIYSILFPLNHRKHAINLSAFLELKLEEYLSIYNSW